MSDYADDTGGNSETGASTRLSRRGTLVGLGALGVVGSNAPTVAAGRGNGNDENGNGGGGSDGNIEGTPVLDWSELSVETVQEGEIAIPDSGRLYAIVHVAMHDAVYGIHEARGEGFEDRDPFAIDEELDDDEPDVPGASRVAATAAAAKLTLEETLLDYLDEDDDVVEEVEEEYEALYEEQIENDTDGNTQAGIEWGETVGEAVREFRDGSGFFDEFDYPDEEDGYDPGDLKAGQGQVVPEWGNSNLGLLDPWAIDDPADIRDEASDGDYDKDLAPPELDTVQWAVDYNKTKLLGDQREDDLTFEYTLTAEEVEGVTGDLEDVVNWIEDRPTEVEARDFDNEEIKEKVEDDDGNLEEVTIEFERPEDFQNLGNFWVALPGTAQPDGRWVQIANAAAEDNDLELSENAQLLADVAVAAVDGAVTSWNTKRKYAVKEVMGWRPHAPLNSFEKNDSIEDDDPPTADDDGNPLTEADDEWFTISGHAASGEHPSGLTLASTAAQNVLDDYFPDIADGDDDFTVEVIASGEGAEEGETIEETFDSFEEARRIAMDTREYTGRHYRFSLEASAQMGQKVADEVLDN